MSVDLHTSQRLTRKRANVFNDTPRLARGVDINRDWPARFEMQVTLDAETKPASIARKLGQTDRPEFRKSHAEVTETPCNGFVIGINLSEQPGCATTRVEQLGSGAYSAKLLAGTKQRLSGFSQPRQCGEVVLRMFVTGYPPARGGGGMPQRIRIISRSPPALRTTGAG